MRLSYSSGESAIQRTLTASQSRSIAEQTGDHRSSFTSPANVVYNNTAIIPERWFSRRGPRNSPHPQGGFQFLYTGDSLQLSTTSVAAMKYTDILITLS